MDTNIEESKKLQEIGYDVLAMSGMVENAIAQAIEALKKRDLALAHQIMADDAKINEKRFVIENKCIQIIAKEQPAEAELRAIVSILNIITELERIGDYAEGIAKIVILIGDEPPLKPLVDIPRMAELTIDMIHGSIAAFMAADAKKAAQVIGMDNSVDNLYDQVFRELLTFMMADPKTVTRATRFIWVTHNLERAADRATNICERVVYMVTGKMAEIGASKY